MKLEQLLSNSIGPSYGMGFLAILGMVGVFSSLFILWSISCLGGATFDLATRLI